MINVYYDVITILNVWLIQLSHTPPTIFWFIDWKYCYPIHVTFVKWQKNIQLLSFTNHSCNFMFFLKTSAHTSSRGIILISHYINRRTIIHFVSELGDILIEIRNLKTVNTWWFNAMIQIFPLWWREVFIMCVVGKEIRYVVWCY